MKTENIDEICETNQHELTHEQDIQKKEFIKFLEWSKIPRTEWVFHLDDPETWDWDNSLWPTRPFGPLNVGTDAVLSAAS